MTSLLLLIAATALAAEPIVFNNVLVRESKKLQSPKAGGQRLVDRHAKLTFDDATQHLQLQDPQGPLDVPYADVTKVIFEVSEHMRGNNEAATFTSLAGAIVPGAGIASMIIAGQHVKDFLCYFEVRQPNEAPPVPHLLEIGKDSIDKVKEKMNAVFAGRVVDMPQEVGEKYDRGHLPDLSSKDKVVVNKVPRPLPEVQPGKALVLVLARTPSSRNSGQGTQIKLHANGSVVAVNKFGTWTYAYLDPGNTLLVSQADNASSLQIKLEAGKDYYFIQNMFLSLYKTGTTLSRHSKELVAFEATGAYYSAWTHKGP